MHAAPLGLIILQSTGIHAAPLGLIILQSTGIHAVQVEQHVYLWTVISVS
jgi:hypothetical protein